MKNAETASEIRMSLTHLANTGGTRLLRTGVLPGSIGCEGVPRDRGTFGSVGMKLMVGVVGVQSIIENTGRTREVAMAR